MTRLRSRSHLSKRARAGVSAALYFIFAVAAAAQGEHEKMAPGKAVGTIVNLSGQLRLIGSAREASLVLWLDAPFTLPTGIAPRASASGDTTLNFILVAGAHYQELFALQRNTVHLSGRIVSRYDWSLEGGTPRIHYFGPEADWILDVQSFSTP